MSGVLVVVLLLGSQTPSPPRPLLLRTAGRLRHCKNNKLSYLQSRVLSTLHTTLHSAGASISGKYEQQISITNSTYRTLATPTHPRQHCGPDR